MKKLPLRLGVRPTSALVCALITVLSACHAPATETPGSGTTSDVVGDDAQTGDAADVAEPGDVVGKDAADTSVDAADATDTVDAVDAADTADAADADTAPDVAADVPQDTAADDADVVAPDDTVDATAPDAAPDAAPDSAPDAAPDVAPDVADDAAPDSAGPDDVGTDVTVADVDLTDVPVADVLDDAADDVAVTDVADDVLVDAADDTGADADDTADATDPFAQCVPCDAANPCAVGACAASALGACCVPTCTDTCKTGASCLTLPDNPGIKACVPDHITLCRPCQQATDCVESGFQPGAVCHVLAPDIGAFCATPCSATTACPAGYACQPVAEGTPGASFCVPEAQVCTCDDLSKAKQLTTTCSHTNAFGTCTGTRLCDATGLTQCNAGSASAETCDGLDNDCDGLTDEDIAPIPSACGKGACAESGNVICVAGQLIDTCAEGTPAATDTSCNNVDDNCDGQTDEGFVKLSTTCGAGACASTGLQYCAQGALKDSCVTSDPGNNDANCNGIDDNCDGVTDEGYVTLTTTCGTGACATTGKTSCVAGLVKDSCLALTPALADTSCNGVDDNCDGKTDEGYTPVATGCGKGACVAAGITSCVAGKVQDSCQPGTPAATDVTCNGIDDNCNGKTDDDYAPQLTGCGIGACTSLGITSCVAGTVHDSCKAGTPAVDDANCNGIDDDCSGDTDEDYVQTSTTCGIGACAATGIRFCQGAKVVNTCAAGTPANSDASCDNVDNNCNGQTDESFTKTQTTCGTGACANEGLQYCEAGQIKDSCVTGGVTNDDANCNGIDDDCNGLTDDAYVPVASVCGTGACQSAGIVTCVAGQTVNSCVAGTPAASDTTCDGIDDNCNEQTDEGYAPLGTQCGQGVCAATGKTSCVLGKVENSCKAGLPALTDETCDGADDNCNGLTDEDYGPQITSCGTGACTSLGVTSCVSAQVLNSCKPNAPAATDASCDNVDNNCDGQTDEGYQVLSTTCGVGACAATGVTRCLTGGVEEDTCTPDEPAPSDANCNNVDDNCNGQTDEGFVHQATACGVGACASFGQTSCAAGQVKNSCVAFAPGPNDTNCNGKDDDCNGLTDDTYQPVAVTCGKGVCAAVGQTACEQGSVVDHCTVGTPLSGDSNCNGLDDNCNGQTDEAYVPTSTFCGVGACAAAGQTTCVGGVVGDSCKPGAGAQTDTTCNGIDDNCNGQTDEGYVQTATTCGLGQCAGTGHTYCDASIVKDTCTTLPPAANDVTCDGKDDNCNGQTDEGFGFVATSCGTGLCKSTGIGTCVQGHISDTCTPGTPGSDANCDGKDNNCNGQTDEGYVTQATSCGVGECATTGTRTCVGGAVVDSCAPLAAPEKPEVSCDNKDNDCDGKTDAADSDMSVYTCCAGNSGQFNVDTARTCPVGWFCDQSWDTLDGKSTKYERKCYFGGSGSGSSDGECSPYDCGKATSTVQQDGAALTYDWCAIFKSYTILGVPADDINAICGWSTNGILTSNAARSGNGSSGNAEEFSGFWCSCNPICETSYYGASQHKCCKNLFATGNNSTGSTYGGFKCGKTHVNTSTSQTFQDPHNVGSRCRHNVECLGGMKCSTPGTYAADGTPIPTKAPTAAGTCS